MKKFQNLLLSIILGYLKDIKLNDSKILLSKLEDLDDISEENVQFISQFISEKSLQSLRTIMKSNEEMRSFANEFIEKNMDEDIDIISWSDERYPRKLKEIQDSPLNLFIKGNIKLLEEDKTVAVVGTRKASNEGIKVAYDLSKILSEAGYVVISGLAEGIDTQAHQSTLDHNGKTAGIIATDLREKSVFPKENLELSKKILEFEGVLVTEVPLDSPPVKQRFLLRNRIQTGLSNSVVVIETGDTGGTLHTIRFAEKQNRSLVCPNFSNEFNNDLVPKKIQEKSGFLFDKSFYGLIEYLESLNSPKNQIKEDKDEPNQISLF